MPKKYVMIFLLCFHFSMNSCIIFLYCVCCCLIDPVITSDHSSSSTDSSPTGETRKSTYLSRKSKSKTSVQSGSSVKQRVRSSSGYSSHTEETSFRFVLLCVV